MIRSCKDRRCASQRRSWIDQFGGVIDRAAYLAGVAVLVGGTTFRASALDVSIRQKHRLDRIEELFNLAHINQARIAQGSVDRLGEFDVFGGVG